MSNAGLIGFPSGRNLMDGTLGPLLAADGVSGTTAHYVNMALSPDAVTRGMTFRYAPEQANTGPVSIWVNSMGPFALYKQERTTSIQAPASLLPLVAGDIVAGRTIEVMLYSFPTSDLVAAIILSGVQPNPTDVGIDLMNALDQAAVRTIAGLASGATTTVGTAATRNVGAASGQVPIIVDGSGNLDPFLNVAKKDLGNLQGAGWQRTQWAAVSFAGATGVELANFNGALATRVSIGLYDVAWPPLGGVGTFSIIPVMDTPDTDAINKCTIVSGSRTATSVRISSRTGGIGADPFDPERMTVSIFAVG